MNNIPLIIVSAIYIATQVLSDIGSLRIINFFGLAMDGGTFIYPLTFTLRDMVHKVGGKTAAQVLIISAAVINLVMAGYFWLVSILPAAPNVVQPDFGSVLAPVWRIVFASILAEVVSELVDTEAYHLWVSRVTTRFQWMRVLVSNSISIPLDSMIFGWAAFGGQYTNAVVWSIVLSNVIVKGVTTLIGLPLIYVVKEREKEQTVLLDK